MSKSKKWPSIPDPNYEFAIWVEQNTEFKDAANHHWLAVPWPRQNVDAWEYKCNCSHLPVRIVKYKYNMDKFIFLGQCSKCKAILWTPCTDI